MQDIVDANGTSVVLQSTFGQLTTNAKGQCSNEAGVLLPEVLAYGLGAGQFTNPEVGGEESFAGRVDGVWLYSKSSVLLEEIKIDIDFDIHLIWWQIRDRRGCLVCMY